MKLISKFRFYLGIIVFLILIASYFVKFNVDVGDNYVEADSLLGILIFHNVFVLSFYILIGCLLVFTGIKRVRII